MAVAHGCTGKGNDQVRFDVTFPDARPATQDHRSGPRVEVDPDPGAAIRGRPRNRGRGDQEEHLQHRPEPLGTLDRGGNPRRPLGRAPARDLSVDRRPPQRARRARGSRDRIRPRPTDRPEWPTRDGTELIEELNKIAGRHGVGRIDHIENRLVGIKSREIYEAPAAIVLHEAHREIEFLTLSKDALRFKTLVSQAIFRPDLQRPLVQCPAPGFDGVCRLEPAIRLRGPPE